MGESVDLQEMYINDLKKEFVEKVKSFLEHKLSQQKSWTDIKKHLKVHLYNILNKTKDHDILEKDQKDEIVNNAYNKISPIIEKKAEQEAKNKPRPTIKNRFLKRPSFLTGTRKMLASLARTGTRSRSRNGLKLNRSGNSFGMGSLARALNDL